MPDAEGRTTVLLERWNAGDQEALVALVEKHVQWVGEHVERRLGALLRARAEPGDYVQDAILEFLRYGPRITVSTSEHFRALLARIVENTVRNKHRWWTNRRRDLARERPIPSDSSIHLTPPKSPITPPSEAAQRHENEAIVRLGLELLDVSDREVIVLREYDGLSFPEIGRQLEANPDAVRMRYNRAFHRLSEVVGQLRRGQLGELLDGELDGHEEG